MTYELLWTAGASFFAGIVARVLGERHQERQARKAERIDRLESHNLRTDMRLGDLEARIIELAKAARGEP